MHENNFHEWELRYGGKKKFGSVKAFEIIDWYKTVKNSKQIQRISLDIGTKRRTFKQESFDNGIEPLINKDYIANETIQKEKDPQRNVPLQFSKYETINSGVLNNENSRKVENYSFKNSWHNVESLYAPLSFDNSKEANSRISLGLIKKHEENTQTTPQSFIDPQIEKILNLCKQEKEEEGLKFSMKESLEFPLYTPPQFPISKPLENFPE